MNNLNELFKKPFIGAIVGDINCGKSNLIYHIIQELQKNQSFKLYTYGLRFTVNGATEIHSIDELENIRNGFICIDEFYTLLDLTDRRNKGQVERTLRLLHHNNNIILLSGLPENFKKFISAKINLAFYKKVTFADFINGSSIKRNILKYQGMERGSSILNLKINECIIYDGLHYHKYQIPYISKNDSKLNNVPIFVKKVSE